MKVPELSKWNYKLLLCTAALLMIVSIVLGLPGADEGSRANPDALARPGGENQRTESLRCPARPPLCVPHPVYGRPAHPLFRGGSATLASPGR